VTGAGGGPHALIVGAGPAGSATALILARAGLDVLLLDRHAFPRPKPCGDCLSAGAGAVLRRLDVLDRIRVLDGARLAGWRIVAPDGHMFTSRFRGDDGGGHALAIDRATLDMALLQAAVAAGATFVPHAQVTDLLFDRDRIRGVRVREPGSAGVRDIPARLTIGADGLRSVVAARLRAVGRGRIRKVSLTTHIDAAISEGPFGEMHAGDGVVAGVAPVTADGRRCNLTIVADADRFGRAVAADPGDFASRAIASLPRLRHRATAIRAAGRTYMSSGPFHRPSRRVAFDGAALVGDAGGYYDPFTGQGIFQALTSAELLADAVLNGGGTAAALRRYAAARAALLRGPRLVQRGIEYVLARPRLANAAIARIARADEFAAAILAVTADTAPARRLLSPRALSSLIHPPHQQETT
jgi:menaquinone-9 beta-reductase